MSAHPIRCQKLLTGIRGNAILRLSRYERGFHDGNVKGAFFFCDIPFRIFLSNRRADSLSITSSFDAHVRSVR